MISRRPNRRASSESAPGPSNTRAAAINPTRAADNFASNKSGRQAGIHVSAMPALPNPVRAAATGVRMPISSAAPLTAITRPRAQAIKVEWRSKQPPCRIAANPAATRKSSRPAPGFPPGNVENALCS